MNNKFERWHTEKSSLHEDKQRPYFREGETWMAALGANIGFEQDGRGNEYLRPIVVIKKFNKEICWGIPLTKTEKSGLYYHSFTLGNARSTAILSQIRLVDAKRLFYRIGTLSKEDLVEMKKRLRALLP